METIRLDKFLADIPVGTRSQVKEIIRAGRVAVNGVVVKKPEAKLDPSEDEVCLDRKPLLFEKTVWYMLNKPAGVLSAARDKKQKTVLDLIEGSRKDLFPVGRLDKDTTGLLLITNDGELAHRLLSPKRHCDKVYAVTTDAPVPELAGDRFREGMDLGDFITQPAKWVQTSRCSGLITVHEGKFHQVRRMFSALGLTVVSLDRRSFGGLTLDGSLEPGQSRRLTPEEIRVLRDAAGYGKEREEL